MHSNVYWPQTRASYVIVFLQSVESLDVQCIRQFVARPDFQDWSFAPIVRTADQLHEAHGIWTVHPTRHTSVERELHQSNKVLLRILEDFWSDWLKPPYELAELNGPATRLWKWVQQSEFVELNRELIKGPQRPPAEATKVLPEDNPVQHSHYDALCREFPTGLEARILRSLKDEILHSITVVRA